MYIRYNNSSNERHNQGTPHNPPPPKPHRKEEARRKNPGSKNFLEFLPKEIYNSETHKFFGRISSEDILLIGLILLILDKGCKDDFALVLALGYILLSDFLDLGNILF